MIGVASDGKMHGIWTRAGRLLLMRYSLAVLASALILAGCGTLEKKAILINPGDGKEAVIKAMGTPRDRQFLQTQEAWQYCKSATGFYDYRIVWFRDGAVTGVTSYKRKPHMGELSCAGRLESVRWEDAPDATIEVRNR